VAEEVTLPQLGESVTEGTITAWLVDEGDHVEEDQPIFEISTEKIDTEVPSPASGVLKEIRAQVDDTVEVGEVVAIIETDADAEADEPDDEAAPAEDEADEEDAAADQDEEAAPSDEDEEADDEEKEAKQPAAEEEPEPSDADREPDGEASGELLSPIVRKMVREHDLDPSRIKGSGQGGRITREDVERAIETKGERAPATTTERPAAPAARKPGKIEGRQRKEKLPRVRQIIAKGMWESLQTTAQLTAAVEVDVTPIMRLRARVKDEFAQREGVSLSPLPFFARAVCMVLPSHPSMNSAIDVEEGTATYYEFVNLGIAVDAEQGLIVPNIKSADDLTIPALARAINDVAERTRNRKLQPDEVKGGTFTITNTGSRGVLFDTPILNPPEVAILATPKIEKRPIVVTQDGSDSIAIRQMTYLCLTYDHRMVDGADAARFLGDLKKTLETHDWGAELGY
jgi:pyruvate dehydrogenase E2 component (dihydrolipoamide acetyltransferase)